MRAFGTRHLRAIVAITILLAPSLALGAATAQTEQCFTETGRCVRERFAEYWNANGGLPVFGFPLTTSAYEASGDASQSYLTQWFERNRFEAHPENPAPYDVLLGRLGNDRLAQQGRDWTTFPKAAPTANHYFEATGHAIAHAPFWEYWSTHGLLFDGVAGVSAPENLALFGLPLSEPQMETNRSGDTVLTQWFERARFEDHGSKGVLLGLLGDEVLHGHTPTLPPEPAPAPPLPTYACHPSYPTICIPPPPPDLDCEDIPHRNFPVIGLDPHAFDPDRDGTGCEG